MIIGRVIPTLPISLRSNLLLYPKVWCKRLIGFWRGFKSETVFPLYLLSFTTNSGSATVIRYSPVFGNLAVISLGSSLRSNFTNTVPLILSVSIKVTRFPEPVSGGLASIRIVTVSPFVPLNLKISISGINGLGLLPRLEHIFLKSQASPMPLPLLSS